MAQRSQEQSILVSPSISDRLLSDKANSNFCFLGWWAVFAPKSKSSGLCWIRLAGFYLLFRTSSANPRLGGITKILRIVLAEQAYYLSCKPIGSFCGLQIK
uniref:Uncharacterized protein n=1 Tax=Cucumis sativus TaxID=3659 RepID=A0A0A0K7J3_CUCSA